MPDTSTAVPGSELLIVDPDPLTADLCRELAASQGLTVRTAADTDAVVDSLESGLVNVLLLNDEFPLTEHLEFLRHIRYWYPETQIVILADSPSFSAAVETTKLGAFDYLPKPLDHEVLRHTIERAMEQSRMEAAQGTLMRQSVDADGAWGMVGRSPAMTKVFNIINKLSRSIHPILILGESGTGKELAARAIHFSSVRKDRPFIPVDCVALVPTLMESELFGHEKGSFTGPKGPMRVFFESPKEVPSFSMKLAMCPLNSKANFCGRSRKRRFVRWAARGESVLTFA